jgi:hypothetical protein
VTTRSGLSLFSEISLNHYEILQGASTLNHVGLHSYKYRVYFFNVKEMRRPNSLVSVQYVTKPWREGWHEHVELKKGTENISGVPPHDRRVLEARLLKMRFCH